MQRSPPAVPNSQAPFTMLAQRSWPSMAHDVNKNPTFCLGHLLTTNIRTGHFLPEEASPWPPCWPALLALVAALDCALAAKPPEDMSLPPVAFGRFSNLAHDCDIERVLPGSFGFSMHPLGTFGCFLFPGWTF